MPPLRNGNERMARILYGVHGTGHGHAIRALTVARRFPEHEFLFVSHSDGAAILSREYTVFDCPNPVTPIRNHKVATGPVIFQNAGFFLHEKELFRSVLDQMERFKPDVALTDYEYLVPRACRKTGIPCLSVDHQHITNFTDHSIPRWQYRNYLLNYWASRFLFTEASEYLVISFFHPPMKKNVPKAVLAPPLLRESVLANMPSDGGYVLVYQGFSTTFKNFFPFLRSIDRNVIVYGFNSDHLSGNLQFKKNSEAEFLADLAGCTYVICGGGHTMISESLYYGKPVLSIPFKNAFEQQLNAHYVEKLGYGLCCSHLKPGPGIIPEFEANLDQCRRKITEGNFIGNQEIFELVGRFIQRCVQDDTTPARREVTRAGINPAPTD
ncbi:teichoic acid biosynthesis related protein [Syntrophobacter fumaroxidans MPOB]|uniref:Teichoic acid biosynthesis related protein n=2 Tax=Syntrophobacter TaxID=29526 RepID=A0LKI4_SYNFM|nr:teichoic acid biosynthesis related protein [Syntrophobacter fumaroxidans MPOB]